MRALIQYLKEKEWYREINMLPLKNQCALRSLAYPCNDEAIEVALCVPGEPSFAPTTAAQEQAF
jgi:hypothetical protein